MAQVWNTSFDWYKNKEQSAKSSNKAASALAYIKDNNMLNPNKKRYVWPETLDDGSHFMSRKIFGREMLND